MNTSRLLVHVQKGWEDGLYISCVASSANLWGIVMDAGTEFVQQIYKVHYSSFLPKVRTLRGSVRPGRGRVQGLWVWRWLGLCAGGVVRGWLGLNTVHGSDLVLCCTGCSEPCCRVGG